MKIRERISFFLKKCNRFVENPERFLNIIAKFENYLDKNNFAQLFDAYKKKGMGRIRKNTFTRTLRSFLPEVNK